MKNTENKRLTRDFWMQAFCVDRAMESHTEALCVHTCAHVFRQIYFMTFIILLT